MNAFQNAFDSLVEQSEKLAQDGDYIGDDGLLRCGKCNQKKQCEVKINYPSGAVIRRPYIMCACEREKYQRSQKEEEVKELKRVSLMDEALKEVTFEAVEINQRNERVFGIGRQYVEMFDVMYKNNQGLLLYGPPGTGKTWLAACIANALLDRGTRVIMTSFVKLLSVSNLRKEDDEETIRRITGAPLLIVDDLGAERETDYALERVYNIIDSRYRAKKPMILTTNLSMDEIKRTDSIRHQRIYDRIIQYCYPVEFACPSWRRREAGRRFDEMKKILEVQTWSTASGKT